MLYTDKAIIVEGKYDKIKLSSVIDGVIIQTNGFELYKNEEKRRMIKLFADKAGIIILTDSDSAGFQIRNYIKSFVSSDKITNVYIPDIFGKEKRKDKPSKEGKLGVEGVSAEILIKAFESSGALCAKTSGKNITNLDLYELGLVGTKDAHSKRKALLKALDLPEHISSKAMLDILNKCFSKDELINTLYEISPYK